MLKSSKLEQRHLNMEIHNCRAEDCNWMQHVIGCSLILCFSSSSLFSTVLVLKLSTFWNQLIKWIVNYIVICVIIKNFNVLYDQHTCLCCIQSAYLWNVKHHFVWWTCKMILILLNISITFIMMTSRCSLAFHLLIEMIKLTSAFFSCLAVQL